MTERIIPTEFGEARFEGTRSPILFIDNIVRVLNGSKSGQVGTVISVTGHAYRSDNRVVVLLDSGDVCWLYPWDLHPVQ